MLAFRLKECRLVRQGPDLIYIFPAAHGRHRSDSHLITNLLNVKFHSLLVNIVRWNPVKVKKHRSFAHVIRRDHVNRIRNADHAARTCERFVSSIVKITRLYDYQTWQTHFYEKFTSVCMQSAILDKSVGTISNFPPPPTQCWSVEIKLPHYGHL